MILRMKSKLLILILSLLSLSFPAVIFSQAEKPVEILLFYSAHCRPCQKVKEEVFPRLKEKYKEKINIVQLDFDKPENYLRLLGLQEQYNWHPDKNFTPTLFIDGRFLVGLEDINKYLEIHIDTALTKKGYSPVKTESSIDLLSRFKIFTPLAIIGAGLADGVNPCAFTAIIFFISFLTLQGYTKRQILIIGLSFILAVFLTYILIGLGLFNLLFQLKVYWIGVKIVYIIGALLCFTLAGLAFYDFVKFRRTHQTQELVLQLPQRLKDRIHRIIGLHYRKGKDIDDSKRHILRLIVSAFIVGFLVCLFEAVCTGQVYLPTIVFVLKTTPLKLKAFFYLLIYNLMFILPLLLILLFALWGVTSGQFSKLAQKYIVAIKLLMVTLFLGLGIFLVWH